MAILYVWVNTKHDDNDLIYVTSGDSTLELEKLQVEVLENESVFDATKRTIQTLKGE